MARTKGAQSRGPAVIHCHRCKREIIGYTDAWAYRRDFRMAGTAAAREHIFCTWSCLCAAQREADAMYGVKADKYELARESRLACDRRYQRNKAKKEKA